MQKSYQGNNASIDLVPNGFFYTQFSSKLTTFVRHKVLAAIDNHSTYFKNATTFKDQDGFVLVTIDKSDFPDFDDTVLKDLASNWKAFWGV